MPHAKGISVANNIANSATRTAPWMRVNSAECILHRAGLASNLNEEEKPQALTSSTRVRLLLQTPHCRQQPQVMREVNADTGVGRGGHPVLALLYCRNAA